MAPPHLTLRDPALLMGSKRMPSLIFAVSLLEGKCSSKDHIHTSVWLRDCFMAPTRAYEV